MADDTPLAGVPFADVWAATYAATYSHCVWSEGFEPDRAALAATEDANNAVEQLKKLAALDR